MGRDLRVIPWRHLAQGGEVPGVAQAATPRRVWDTAPAAAGGGVCLALPRSLAKLRPA
jgi:hypothetical protein